MKRLAEYYHLAKPGIVYGNALTTLAAFLFASRFHLEWPLFPATLFGIAFVIGSASERRGCVLAAMGVPPARRRRSTYTCRAFV